MEAYCYVLIKWNRFLLLAFQDCSVNWKPNCPFAFSLLAVIYIFICKDLAAVQPLILATVLGYSSTQWELCSLLRCHSWGFWACSVHCLVLFHLYSKKDCGLSQHLILTGMKFRELKFTLVQSFSLWFLGQNEETSPMTGFPIVLASTHSETMHTLKWM